MQISATEPKVSTSNTLALRDRIDVRNNCRGTSMRGVKTEYNRKFRRTRHEEAAQELADYQAHGAY